MYKNNWYKYDKQVIKNLLDLNIDIFREMYGSLSDDSHSPYSRISVANSTFSIDPTRGCPLNCAYCVTLSNARDLDKSKISGVELSKDYAQLFSKKLEVLFDGNILIKALNNFPGFIKNKSVISLCTGSSDPFLKENQRQMELIFDELIKLNLKNPIWIVSKYGIPQVDIKYMKEIFSRIIKNGNKVVVSVTYSGAPKEIEPYQGDRFSGMLELRTIGVHISQHLRPIIKGVNDSEGIIKEVIMNNYNIPNSLCIGGLRLDPSIILTWKYIHNLPSDILPNKPGEKDMPEDYISKLKRVLKNKNIPIYTKSSEVISNHLGVNDYNLYSFRKNIKSLSYLFSLTKDQIEKIEFYYNLDIITLISNIIKEIGIEENLEVHFKEDDIYTNIKLNYQGNRLIIHSIGHSNLLFPLYNE